MTILQSVWDVVKWGLLGIAAGIVLILVLVLGSKVIAQEAIPTYDAPSGMQDRGFNYKSPQTVETIIYHEESYTPSRAYDCYRYNAKLVAMIHMIAREIAADPSIGYIYAGALTTIREVWCHQ